LRKGLPNGLPATHRVLMVVSVGSKICAIITATALAKPVVVRSLGSSRRRPPVCTGGHGAPGATGEEAKPFEPHVASTTTTAARARTAMISPPTIRLIRKLAAANRSGSGSCACRSLVGPQTGDTIGVIPIAPPCLSPDEQDAERNAQQRGNNKIQPG